KKYSLPNAYAFDVSFLNNSTDFYLSASDNFIYKFEDGKVAPYVNTESRIYDMSLLTDNLLATGNNAGKIEIWDMQAKKLKVLIREENNKYIHSLAFANG